MDPVRQKKLVIFLCGVFLFFFTSMSKVVVPGTIFGELQKLGFNGAAIAALGASYMYAYAAGQLALGVLANRYGGVRILIFGTICFTAGSLLFPCFSSPGIMAAMRGLTGLGAGTVFIALAKMIADLFPDRFPTVLGIVLFLGYIGTVTGGLPTVWLISRISWRPTLWIPGILCAIASAVILIFCRGTIAAVVKGQTLKPLWQILRNWRGCMLFLASSIVFGSYYAILTTVGQKSLEDFAGYGSYTASFIITVLAGIVAINNLLTGTVIRLCGNRRRILVVFALMSSLLGVVLGAASFYAGLPGLCLAAAFVLTAIPAGFFSIFSTVAKDLYPQELVGLAVAILNFFAFVAIALAGNIAGWVLKAFEAGARHTADGTLIYPPEAYGALFALFSAFTVIGLAASFAIPARINKQ